MLREITANQFGPDDQNVFDIRDGHAFRLSRAFHSIARFLGCNQLASKAEKITNKKIYKKKAKENHFWVSQFSIIRFFPVVCVFSSHLKFAFDWILFSVDYFKPKLPKWIWHWCKNETRQSHTHHIAIIFPADKSLSLIHIWRCRRS